MLAVLRSPALFSLVLALAFAAGALTVVLLK
jgi:hypothetical protein